MAGTRRSPRKATEDAVNTEQQPDAEKAEEKEADATNKVGVSETKVEVATTVAVLPPYPVDRDVVVGDDTHKGTMMLMDLIQLHYFIVKKEKGGDVANMPTLEKDVDALASRLTDLMLEGKKIVLSGIRDVPAPFLKGPGRFFEKVGELSTELSKEEAKAYVAKTVVAKFKEFSASALPAASEVESSVETLFHNCDPANRDPDEPSQFSAPRPCDVLFLPIDYIWEESMPYEHQSGNKHLLYLASQYVATDTNDTHKRVDASFKLVTSKVEVNAGTELLQKTPRYVAQDAHENQNSWRELGKEELAEFACIFTFEVFLEKQIHSMGGPLASQISNMFSETAKPSTVPIDGEPGQLDVLFGRGGGTNGWPGNRRFRDIISLHRPDYIRATKMDKPNVARRIVRAIRQGNPPGNFLKKGDDGKWYDVGDRCAAEKTSQGLRERSNAEKRQRSALREALRIRKEDLEDGKEEEYTAKKAKIEASLGLSTVVAPYVGVGQMNYSSGIPLSLSMKEHAKDNKERKSKSDKDDGDTSESLPPNAVDKDGNILVTEYDILCGRGGLTNHHKGNKRFRDIVALHRPDYVRAPKIQKPSVARVIVRAIRNGDPPGRFLRKDESTGKWIDIGDKKAAEKTSQALREKTGDEKEERSVVAFQSPTLIVPAAAPAGAGQSEGSKTEDGQEKKNEDEVEDKKPAAASDGKGGKGKDAGGKKKGKAVSSVEV